MKLLLATRNKNKLSEIRAIFNIPGLEIIAAEDIEGLPEVEEDADTFEGNAFKKARTLCKASGLWTMADDSGLQVDALHGEPGVYSSRYAGEHANDAKNNAKLLKNLEGVTDRFARFRCTLALVAPDGREWTVSGTCEGHIANDIMGPRTFGYDPVFIPEGHDQSFSQMSHEAKNAISHRGRALAKAAAEWGDLLSGEA